jgi:hypothetical protein
MWSRRVDRGVQRAIDDHDVGAGDRAGGVGPEHGLERFVGVGQGVIDGVKHQAGAGVAGPRREDPEFADLDGGFGVARQRGWCRAWQSGVGAAAVDHAGAGRRVERAGAQQRGLEETGLVLEAAVVDPFDGDLVLIGGEHDRLGAADGVSGGRGLPGRRDRLR